MRKLAIIILGWLFSSYGLLPVAYSLPWPPEMDLVYIKFNYTSGFSYDALTIKRNNSTQIQVPEWYPAYSRNEPMAYIKSQSDRFIEAKFWVDRTGFNHAGIYADMSESGIGDVPEQGINFNDTQYATQTLECSGSVPSSVGIRSFSWNWYVTYIDEVEFEDPLWIAESGDHEYYTLLDEPQSPMAEPWTEVLDYACDWASGTTSEYNAVREITKGAYNDFGNSHSYDGTQTHAPGTTFHLTSFLSDDDADCRDMSAVVHVFSRAIGASPNVRKIWGQFYTKSIDPIGNGNDWQITLWNFHQVAWSDVYDACLRLNPNNPRIPVDEDINGNYKNDLYYSGYWNPDTPFNYSTVD